MLKKLYDKEEIEEVEKVVEDLVKKGLVCEAVREVGERIEGDIEEAVEKDALEGSKI